MFKSHTVSFNHCKHKHKIDTVSHKNIKDCFYAKRPRLAVREIIIMRSKIISLVYFLFFGLSKPSSGENV